MSEEHPTSDGNVSQTQADGDQGRDTAAGNGEGARRDEWEWVITKAGNPDRDNQGRRRT